MRFIRGHNSVGMDRSGARTTHYVEMEKGFATPCWIWQLRKSQPNARSGGGYGNVRVKGRDLLAHRWYYEQANGPIPAGMQLDHLCRNRDCVNPDHMEVVTPLENTRRSRSAKLTYDQSVEIHRRRTGGEKATVLAEEFGVSRETIRLIARQGPDKPRRPRSRS